MYNSVVETIRKDLLEFTKPDLDDDNNEEVKSQLILEGLYEFFDSFS